MDISVHNAKELRAVACHGAGSSWVDLIIADRKGAEYTITAFFSGADRQSRADAYASGINAVNQVREAA